MSTISQGQNCVNLNSMFCITSLLFYANIHSNVFNKKNIHLNISTSPITCLLVGSAISNRLIVDALWHVSCAHVLSQRIPRAGRLCWWSSSIRTFLHEWQRSRKVTQLVSPVRRFPHTFVFHLSVECANLSCAVVVIGRTLRACGANKRAPIKVTIKRARSTERSCFAK